MWVCIRGFLPHAHTLNRNCSYIHQWNALGLLSKHLEQKGLSTISPCLILPRVTSSPMTASSSLHTDARTCIFVTTTVHALLTLD